jgi:hypothetical protein
MAYSIGFSLRSIRNTSPLMTAIFPLGVPWCSVLKYSWRESELPNTRKVALLSLPSAAAKALENAVSGANLSIGFNAILALGVLVDNANSIQTVFNMTPPILRASPTFSRAERSLWQSLRRALLWTSVPDP